MSIGIAILILCEAMLALGIVYGWIHEDKVIAWEKRTWLEIKRRLCERWLNKGDLDVVIRYE